MRVAINALALAPGRPGGDATYVLGLLRYLPEVAPDDELLVVVARGARALLPPQTKRVHYVDCAVPHQSLVARALWEQSLLPALLQRYQVDVLHAPINVAPLLTRLPIVLTVHEAEPFMPDSRIPLPLLAWWRVMRQASARKARRILTVSRAARAQIIQWMGLAMHRVDVIPLGFDHHRFFPAPVDPDAGIPRHPYVLWVGRTYPRKNVQRLVEAVALVRKSLPDLTLVLAGPVGWAEADVQKAIARADASGWVLRRGALGPELPDWYRGASVFAFPSLQETFGLPVLEALSCGTPVVASTIDAHLEVASGAAEFVDPVDPNSIARGIERVLRDETRRAELRVIGLQRASGFRWRTTAQATSKAYHLAASL